MRLTKNIQFFIGVHTFRNTLMMKNFVAESPEKVSEVLLSIMEKKEFIQTDGTYHAFIERVERKLLNTNIKTRKMLQIYSLMKSMQMVDVTFRHALFTKFHHSLMNPDKYQLSNEDTESLLWWMKKQCPFRENQFNEAAQSHTLVLYDIFQYMNELKTLPRWEPYIRVSFLLRSIGHQVSIRKDLLKPNELNRVSYRYLPIVGSFLTPFQADELTKEHSLYSAFKNNLSRTFLEKEKVEYDMYLHRVQTIDNQSQGQQIDRTFDVLTWTQVLDFMNLVYCSLHEQSFDSDLYYETEELFWRKLETQNIDIQSAARLIEIITRFPQSQDSQKIVMRTVQSLMNSSIDNIRFGSYSTLKTVFKGLAKTRMQAISKQLAKNIEKIIPDIILWDNQSDRTQLKILLQGKVSQKALKSLENGEGE